MFECNGSISGSTFSGNKSGSEGGAISTSVSKSSLTIADSHPCSATPPPAAAVAVSPSARPGTDPRRRLHDLRQPLHRYQRPRRWDRDRTQPSGPAENTIVAGNSADAGGADLDGPIEAVFSLIGSPSGATLTEPVAGSNLIGVDPQLGPLGDNGGPTQTMAITASSPAVNKGAGGLAADQRGQSRPVAYPGVPFSAAAGANGADIGAYRAPVAARRSHRTGFASAR